MSQNSIYERRVLDKLTVDIECRQNKNYHNLFISTVLNLFKKLGEIFENVYDDTGAQLSGLGRVPPIDRYAARLMLKTYRTIMQYL